MNYLARVEPLDRDIALIVQEVLSPVAQSVALAVLAREALVQAQRVHQQVTGKVPPHRTFVDGVQSDRLEAVRPNGGIAFEFSLVEDALKWVAEQLDTHSPRRSGRYARSNALFVAGVEVALDAIPAGAPEYVFANTQPYAGKIERGLSNQAPDGVYEVVAVLAAQRFGNIARFRFTYRSLDGSKDKNDRQPAIVITV